MEAQVSNLDSEASINKAVVGRESSMRFQGRVVDKYDASHHVVQQRKLERLVQQNSG